MAEAIETDVVVVGSGAAGLAAALTAAVEGQRVVLLEKARLFGGTTAVSGGLVWVPNNHHMPEVGIDDSNDEAVGYMRLQSDARGATHLVEHYVEHAPAMIRYLEQHAGFEFSPVPHYPDYHPELKGGKTGGRPIEGPLFDTKSLGEWAPTLRKSPIFGATPMRVREATEWGAFSNPLGLPYKKLLQRAKDGYVCRGSALCGHLLRACLKRDVMPKLNTAVQRLVVQSGRVVGVVAETASGSLEVRATRGVILGCGGFEWNNELVKSFLGGALTHPNSPPQNDGDGLRMVMRVGAKLSNMTEAWWAPTVLIPGERYDGAPLYRADFAMRTMPHSIIVNQAGRRFVNEALNYNDLMKPFFEMNPNTMQRKNLPAWLILDQQFLDKYLCLTSIPGKPPPEFIQRDDSLADLAKGLGIDAWGLTETVERFNEYAASGVDADFQRGDSEYDRFYGDPKHGPNPCLGVLEQGPFYALEVLPGSLGTKGGPLTDEHGRVLNVDSEPIAGLYAAGNVAASPAGAGYPGPGITIGAALLYGHLAARHAATAEL